MSESPPQPDRPSEAKPNGGMRAIWLGLGVFYAMMVPAVAAATWLEGVTGWRLALGVLATLAAMAAVAFGILRAVDRHDRRVGKVWLELRDRLAADGLRVQVDHTGGKGTSAFVLRIADLDGGVREGLTLAAERLPLPDRDTGDAGFDAQVRVGGEPVEALAGLDAAARGAVLSLLEAHPGCQLADGELRATLPKKTAHADLVALGLQMAEVVMALRSSEPPEVRLARIARSDPLPSVRLRATEILLQRRAEAPAARQLAEDLMAGDDLLAALTAARSLGLAEREAELLALLEAARGQLGLVQADGALALAGAGGELALGERALLPVGKEQSQ